MTVEACPDHVKVEGLANGGYQEDMKVPSERILNGRTEERAAQPPAKPQHQSTQPQPIGPPESVTADAVYLLYRGTCGQIGEKPHRIWAEWPALQLCWALHDKPAPHTSRLDFGQISRCQCEKFSQGDDQAEMFRVYLYGETGGATSSSQVSGAEIPLAVASAGESSREVLCIVSASAALKEFAQALEQVLSSRLSEPSGLKFIQKRLFQYLWLQKQRSMTNENIYEAQAVLAFNLDPKEGIAYLKRKIGKSTHDEVGEWLAHMSTVKGGLDPTMLGGYFSRKDTLDVFKAFVKRLDFAGIAIDVALRRLFDTFKPGGEGQVITRILEYFAEAYFAQWQQYGDGLEPRTAFPNSDTILQVAVSLIMLNTGLHVATKKVGKRAAGVEMTIEEYISNTRRVVTADEVPDTALTQWYDAVKELEISVEPLPRVPFSKLPVQPAIEGWLIAVLSPKDQRRLWAVLALQRLYLFADASEVEPVDAIDLKDAVVLSAAEDQGARVRFIADTLVQPKGGLFCCFAGKVSQPDSMGVADELRAFEVQHPENKPAILQRLGPRPRLALVAESQELMERWVPLIQSGPYQ